MIRIEIEGKDAHEVLHKALDVLNFAHIYVYPRGGSPIPTQEARHDADAGKPGDSEMTLEEAQQHSRVEQMMTEPVAEKRRGRPRKNQLAPAGAPVEVTHPSTPAAQPAVASNTGSTPPVALPAGEAASTKGAGEQQTAVEPTATAPAPSSLTADQVRAKLQEFLQKPGGDEGLKLASKVLSQFGLTKVKQVNDNPQHWAGIIAAVDAELKALS